MPSNVRDIFRKLGVYDWWLLFFATALIFLGLFTLRSLELSSDLVVQNLVGRQFLAIIIGLTIMIFLSWFDYRYFIYLAPLFYLLTVLFLVLVLVLGGEVRGSVRWLEIGGYRFQPSEIAKPLVILSFSSLVFWLRERWSSLKILLVSFVLVLPLVILVFLEPDLSTLIVFIAIWGGVLWFGLPDYRWLIFLGLIGVMVLPLGYTFLNPYQQDRITSFMDPYADPLGSGYNSIQATISVGSGQFWGRQWGQGTQSHLNFLPDKHTDFIFASFCEEQGFAGALFLLFVYTLFLTRFVKIMTETSDYLGQMIVGGIVVMFWVQFIINIGMNIGLLPVTGIPLPFVSYGGTSMMISLLSLGLVQSVKRHTTSG